MAPAVPKLAIANGCNEVTLARSLTMSGGNVVSMAMRRIAIALSIMMFLVASASESLAIERTGAVLWFDGNVPDPNHTVEHRRRMADFVDAYKGGNTFRVNFVSSRQGGALAQAIAAQSYDILVLDLLANRSYLNADDFAALQGFYASGKRALMLDGSFWIRSIRHNRTTNFPGINGATGALTINQLTAILDAGGGILIGTDHNSYQVGANDALRALIPDAKFQGLTSPSTNGSFIGTVLLAHAEPVRAIDILEHWQTIPNQGEAPVGSFTDFQGRPVQLFSLVSTADQPGRGAKRPYISASFDPGDEEFAIDSDTAPVVDDTPPEPELPDNMPTRKGPPKP